MSNVCDAGPTIKQHADIVFFWKCFYGNYDVDVNDFVDEYQFCQ